ncbi:hypothetical protein CYY_008603 [Polysphondylium violaceum]|uniref:Transmembrane protein n=1 Tax=Polysphondylium violaceum TaxID=133409 RepID=A0A8J4PLG0_9MYCE|nr:hypothetical protein CYY_008603 [Polysphondylium violaceum]
MEPIELDDREDEAVLSGSQTVNKEYMDEPLIDKSSDIENDDDNQTTNGDQDENDNKSNVKVIKNKHLNKVFDKIKSIDKEDLKFDHSKYLKSIIYGGMDGLVSIFVSIAVVASGDAKITVLLVIVLSKLIAGAISMGMGDYLGTQADVDYAKGERKREAWELEYYPEGEKKEMVEIYTSRGVPYDVASEVVEILSKNPKGFIDIMMVEELGITPDAETEVAWKNGMVNFLSFLVFGIIPLLPYLFFMIIAASAGLPNKENIGTFITVIILSVVTLFGMGVFKAKETDTVWWKNGISTVLFGCLGALIGFLTVEILKLIFPDIDLSG